MPRVLGQLPQAPSLCPFWIAGRPPTEPFANGRLSARLMIGYLAGPSSQVQTVLRFSESEGVHTIKESIYIYCSNQIIEEDSTNLGRHQ